MNVIDLGIIGLIALCVLFGFYSGFIQSLLNLGGSLLSFAGAFWLFPKLSDMVSSNTEMVRLISSYTDSGSLLGDTAKIGPMMLAGVIVMTYAFYAVLVGTGPLTNVETLGRR